MGYRPVVKIKNSFGFEFPMPKNPPAQKISQIRKLFENSKFLPQGGTKGYSKVLFLYFNKTNNRTTTKQQTINLFIWEIISYEFHHFGPTIRQQHDSLNPETSRF